MMMLEIKNIRVLLGGKKILDEFSLEVKNGEFLAILGKSGCGKSTLLKAVNGFVPCDDGSIYLNGACLDDVPIHKRGIAMVFQDVRLFPHLSVLENVAFGLKMQRVSREDRKKPRFNGWNGFRFPATKIGGRTSFQAGSSSASRSPAPMPPAPKFFCWMNPFRGWTKRLGRKWERFLPLCTKKAATALCLSPTIKTRRKGFRTECL